MKRFLWLTGMALLFLFCSGCGDVFRPVIIPNPPTFPDPRAAHTVMSLSSNGTTDGSAMVVDVSGDSVVSVATGDCSQQQQLCVGVVPVYAVQQSANQVLSLSQGTATSGSPVLTKMIFSGTTISSTPTVSLPANSMPNFVAVAPSDTMAYVSLPNLIQDPVNHPGQATVAVVSTNSNAMVDTIMVGNNPVALAVTPDKSKLYVANRGNGTTGTISAFNTVDFSARTVAGSLSAAPIWLSVRSDSQRVYVLESNGTLASLDTSTSAAPDTLTETSISVPGATVMVYDGRLNRLYIPGGTEVAVVDVSPSAPQILATVNIASIPPSSRSANDPCSTTTVAPLNVTAAAALPDGSRAYIGAYYEDASSGNICPQVTVLNASSNAVKTTAAVPGFANYDAACATTRFRFVMASAGDSSRAYLSACDGGNINVIDTITDSWITALQAPASARAPIPPSTQPPPQNPVFLVSGP